ncbi:hypothetical protein BKA66DRAFT_7035 [Pyrenochaeta sp. MPI-SDFR-AT-0127]|nr:hypothetical protein BKA66DRAFT_7035 [Pyrenochaeta sp. MPI-SDFR-AT-0127]
MVKRTYSQRDRWRPAHEHQRLLNNDDSKKRHKANDSDELYLPTPPPSRGEKMSSLLKKGLKSFSGPISIPDEEVATDAVQKSSNRYPAFDNILKKRYQNGNPKPHNIYGSREDFVVTMNDRTKRTQQDRSPRNSHLPSPPAEIQKKAQQEVCKTETTRKTATLAVQPAARTQSAVKAVPHTSRLSERAVEDEQPKHAYESNVYMAEKTPAPHRGIVGNRLLKRSMEAQIWSLNQSNSPFLWLPEDVRNIIYEYALGGYTINIEFETYRTTYQSNKPQQVTPIFKYHCTTFNRHLNPYNSISVGKPDIRTSNSFTLLNRVCRQLYVETSTLPYKLNMLSFGSHNVMFNFLFMEHRLSRQQLDAITKLVLPDALPQPNILTYLRNLERVFIGIEQDHQAKGWYLVVRGEGEEPRLIDKRYNR